MSPTGYNFLALHGISPTAYIFRVVHGIYKVCSTVYRVSSTPLNHTPVQNPPFRGYIPWRIFFIPFAVSVLGISRGRHISSGQYPVGQILYPVDKGLYPVGISRGRHIPILYPVGVISRGRRFSTGYTGCRPRDIYPVGISRGRNRVLPMSQKLLTVGPNLRVLLTV